MKTLLIPQLDKLYVGTSEDIAKSCISKGLKGPVILSNNHPGVFCKDFRRWGIITVNLEFLIKKKFKSFVGKKKRTLQEIITEDGVCVYDGDISPRCMEKIMIYDSSTNPFMTDLLCQQVGNKKLLNWLDGGIVLAEHLVKIENYKHLMEIDNHIGNRNGLELYYIKEKKSARKLEKEANEVFESVE